MAPPLATPPPGFYSPLPAHSFQTPALNGPYRIQKPSQRHGSTVDSQAIARAFHAEQWEDPTCGNLDPQQQNAQAGLYVPSYANESQYQLQYHNANGVPKGGLFLQEDGALSQQEHVANPPAEHSVHHEHNAAGGGSEVIVTGREEERCDVSNGPGLKVAFSKQPPLSQIPGTPNRSLDDHCFKSHQSCCHGKSQIQTVQDEGSKPVAGDRNDLHENTVPGQRAAESQQTMSRQDEVPNGTSKVSEHAKNHESTPLLEDPQHLGNAQTISHTIPSTCATTGHPLDSAQASFPHQQPHLYSQEVPQCAPYGSNGSPANLTGANMKFSPTHNCNCGDTCSCLGCAAHPYNATTRNHVQSLGNLLANDDNEEEQSSRPRSPYGIPFAKGTNPRLVDDVPSSPVSSHYRPSAFNPTDDDVTSSHELYNEAHVPLFSSSSYYTMEFPMESLGSCTDVSGSCQCGDDCACIGCLTHTGHNGIPLDLDSAVVPASPNGINPQQDHNEDDGGNDSAPERCCN